MNTLFSLRDTFASGNELVPVPEASTLLAVLGLMAPLAWRERRHWMRCREARGNGLSSASRDLKPLFLQKTVRTIAL
jgi:hypothetical protein